VLLGPAGRSRLDRRRRHLLRKDNFFQAYNANADRSVLLDKLGERYEITRTNIKKWPVGSPIQAAADALEILRREHRFDASQVAHIDVRLATAEAAIVNNREIPTFAFSTSWLWPCSKKRSPSQRPMTGHE